MSVVMPQSRLQPQPRIAQMPQAPAAGVPSNPFVHYRRPPPDVQQPPTQADIDKQRGKIEMRDLISSACKALGQPIHEAERALLLLEEDWLTSPEALAALSDDGWRQMRLPLGFKEELKRRLRHGFKVRTAESAAQHRIDEREQHEYPRKAEIPTPARRVADQAWTDVARAVRSGDARRNLQSSEAVRPERRPHPHVVVKPEAKIALANLQAALARRGQEVARRQGIYDSGRVSIRSLSRRFKIWDDDCNGKIDETEFRCGVEELGLKLDEADLDALWQLLDTNGDGTASYEEVVDMLGTGLNERRRYAIWALFYHLDVTKDGRVRAEDLRLRYTQRRREDRGQFSKQHLAHGNLTDEAFDEALERLRRSMGAVSSGVLGFEDFERYYTTISRSIDRDDYFEAMLASAWQLTENWLTTAPPPPAAVTGEKQIRHAPSAPATPASAHVAQSYKKGFTSGFRLG